MALMTKEQAEALLKQRGGTMSKHEFMHFVRQSYFSESFTHEAEDGTLTTYNVTAMRKRILGMGKAIQPVRMEVPADFAEQIRRDRDVDNARVKDRQLNIGDPGICLYYPPSVGHPQGQHLMIDGVHRCLRRIEVLGLNTIIMYLIDPSQAIIAEPEAVMHDLWGTDEYFAKRKEQQ